MNNKDMQMAIISFRSAQIYRVLVYILLSCLLVIFIIAPAYLASRYAIKYLSLYAVLILIIAAYPITSKIYEKKYWKYYHILEKHILQSLGLSDWRFTDRGDYTVNVFSPSALNNYDDIKFFKEHPEELNEAPYITLEKAEYGKMLTSFLYENDFKSFPLYKFLEERIKKNISNTNAYKILVTYTSPKGHSQSSKVISVTYDRLQQFMTDKSLLMTKGEYNKYVKDQQKKELDQKQHKYYDRVNKIIDVANEQKDRFIIKGDDDKLDILVSSLLEKTLNTIRKAKSVESVEWEYINDLISSTTEEINELITQNRRITDYYDSPAFNRLKETCTNLMSTQREFNEYIDEKVKSIADLFGTGVVRNETTHEDIYEYIHPYKKSITPFTAEVSANVFASAENHPLEYVVKNFYPNKERYPEQIQKLHLLVEELETLKDAKLIIDNYKDDIQQYLTEVPSYVIKDDESGFYSRLGFANVDEKTLTVEYKFSYTSNGGKAQRSFTIPMTEETIVKLIELLESKLTMTAFSKEQRALMTSKLRQHIKERDNYTCQICGNSTHSEPNLLLEIDHILPVAKGGCTTESNLQTLCWKCNRHKSSNII